jgi:hypothetical protein
MKSAQIRMAIGIVGLVCFGAADARATLYTSSGPFDAAIGLSMTDSYSAPPYGAGFHVYTDTAMNAFFGETRYTTTGFTDNNIVNDSVLFSGGRAYCGGCNGSFSLDFTHTTIGSAKGVFGVGFDYANFGGPSYDAFITFGDGSTLDVPLQIYAGRPDFFGVTSSSLISSIALGLANGGISTDGSFQESNLIIADPPAAVPEPSALALLVMALVGIAGVGRQKRA